MIEKEIWQRYKDNGLKVLAIGVKEDDERASLWSFHHRLTYPVIIDPDAQIYKKYGSGSVPYHVIIDRTWIIRHSQENFEKESLMGVIQDNLGRPETK